MEELLKDACCLGHVAEVEELLAKGVDPDCPDETGTLPGPLVYLLVPHRSHWPRCAGNYPIHWCCSTKELRCLEVLIKHGAKINVKDTNDNTPLHIVHVMVFIPPLPRRGFRHALTLWHCPPSSFRAYGFKTTKNTREIPSRLLRPVVSF